MIPFFKELLWDENAAKRYFRAFCLGGGGILVSGGVPVLLPYKEYGVIMLALGGLIGAGEKNATTKKED
jgi:hypothetical protein